MGRVKAELIDGMVVVGDLAYLPEEWERLERRRATGRDRWRSAKGHTWQPSDRHAWTTKGAPLTLYVCSTCGAHHGGSPHRGRCGESCGNFFPSLGRVPACTKVAS